MHCIFALLFLCVSHFYLIFLPSKDELSHANHKGSKLGTPHSKASTSVSCQSATAKASAHGNDSHSNAPLSSHGGASPTSTESASATPRSAASDATMETNGTPTPDQEVSDGLQKNLDRNGDKPESNKTIAAVQELQHPQLGHGDGQCNSCSIIGVLISQYFSI